MIIKRFFLLTLITSCSLLSLLEGQTKQQQDPAAVALQLVYKTFAPYKKQCTLIRKDVETIFGNLIQLSNEVTTSKNMATARKQNITTTINSYKIALENHITQTEALAKTFNELQLGPLKNEKNREAFLKIGMRFVADNPLALLKLARESLEIAQNLLATLQQ